MNKELIMKLIDRARESSGNAYCPYTKFPVGCALLADENVIFTGCNIEANALSCSASAGEVAIFKAISEGHTNFNTVCFYSSETMPFPDGKVRQLFGEFNMMLDVIVANDQTYHMMKLSEIFPVRPEWPEID